MQGRLIHDVPARLFRVWVYGCGDRGIGWPLDVFWWGNDSDRFETTE